MKAFAFLALRVLSQGESDNPEEEKEKDEDWLVQEVDGEGVSSKER